MLMLSQIGYDENGGKFLLSEEEITDFLEELAMRREEELANMIKVLSTCLAEIVEDSIDSGTANVGLCNKALKAIRFVRQKLSDDPNSFTFKE